MTLHAHTEYSLPGSSVHGILQARILEWVGISHFRGLPDPRIEPPAPVSPALAGRFFTIVPPGRPGRTLSSGNKPVSERQCCVIPIT